MSSAHRHRFMPPPVFRAAGRVSRLHDSTTTLAPPRRCSQATSRAGGWRGRSTSRLRRPPLPRRRPGIHRSTSAATLADTTTSNASSKFITMAEVREHALRDSAWIVVHGHVYDCTAYLKDYPGGVNIILINAGADCTEEFDGDAIHSDKAKALLALSRIATRPRRSLPSPASASSSPPAMAATAGHPVHETAVICRSPLPAPFALSNPREKVPCRLINRKVLSHDVRLLCFALPAPGQVHLRWGLNKRCRLVFGITHLCP